MNILCGFVSFIVDSYKTNFFGKCHRDRDLFDDSLSSCLELCHVLKADWLQWNAMFVVNFNFDLHCDLAPSGLLALKVAFSCLAKNTFVCDNFTIPVAIARR